MKREGREGAGALRKQVNRLAFFFRASLLFINRALTEWTQTHELFIGAWTPCSLWS